MRPAGGGGARADGVSDVDVVGGPGDVGGVGGAPDTRLTSPGATSQHSRQSAVSGAGTESQQSLQYRHSQLQLSGLTGTELTTSDLPSIYLSM